MISPVISTSFWLCCGIYHSRGHLSKVFSPINQATITYKNELRICGGPGNWKRECWPSWRETGVAEVDFILIRFGAKGCVPGSKIGLDKFEMILLN
jgi:hypothetical protein